MLQLSLLRRALLCGIALNLVSHCGPCVALPPAPGHARSARFIFEPVAGLVACALFTVVATSGNSVKRLGVLWQATGLGLVGGALLVFTWLWKTLAGTSAKTVWSL